MKNINAYDIRGQLKSFADQHGIFGWFDWRQRISLDVEFHCHRTIDLDLVQQHMLDQSSKEIFMIRSENQRDQRGSPLTKFQCPKTGKHHKEIES